MAENADETTRRFTLEAISPDQNSMIDVLVPLHRLQWAKRMGLGAIHEINTSVRHVLRYPDAIFCGINRDGDDDRGQTEGWLCYCGAPAARYDYQTGKLIFRGERVLLVYVNREFTFYNSRWEPESKVECGIPLDMGLPSDPDGKRFKERLR